jgi:hypothetical protein
MRLQLVNHRSISQPFSPQLAASFPLHTGLEKSRADDQGVCPGNDDNEEAPISYFVIEDALGNMGVIRQQRNSF